MSTLKHRGRPSGRPAGRRKTGRRLFVEAVEGRMLLSTFTVSSLADAGPGSLRQAITGANADVGPQPPVIQFSVPGTIRLTTGALPSLTKTVLIDGTTAPGYAGAPKVEVDFNGNAGLAFDAGSAGSALRSLGFVNASGAGITLNDSKIQVVGNFIGVRLDGTTPGGNGGNGLDVNSTSTGNTIGATTTAVPNAATNAISVASNVISANRGVGIGLHGTSGNTLVANYIGTSANGSADLGNGQDGIRLDGGASGNTIGGTIVFNDSNGQLPATNVISGNSGNGVLLTDGAHGNFLGSNFIGTNTTGTQALGNDLDGVAIVGADSNLVAGTFVNLQPFVFANVISGNHANGIRVQDADNNTIHANYFGIGIDNKTPVGNALDGMLVAGSSANTQIGGVIPLGNVSAANGTNGVEIRDTSTGTVAFNTFTGLAAFQDYTNLGNGRNGMLVTSTGGNNVLRTNVVSNNALNGIEISGEASGVQVTEVIIGLNTGGTFAMPNGRDGILIGGDAHHNTIGGDQGSVIPQVTVSANLGRGIVFAGTAHNNLVYRTFVGTDVFGRVALGNSQAGIFLGDGTYANTVGGTSTDYANVVSGNLGDGIRLSGTTANIVSGNYIGIQAPGPGQAVLPLSNQGAGVSIFNSSSNMIGGYADGSANVIAYNSGAGVFVNSGSGNAILHSPIYANGGPGIVLRRGANNNQSSPFLAYAYRAFGNTTVAGAMFGPSYSSYQLEFFATPSGRYSTSGGQTYLGTMTVTTNGLGVGLFSFRTPNPSVRSVFTATATSATRNTSAFSNGVSPLFSLNAPGRGRGWPFHRLPVRRGHK